MRHLCALLSLGLLFRPALVNAQAASFTPVVALKEIARLGPDSAFALLYADSVRWHTLTARLERGDTTWYRVADALTPKYSWSAEGMEWLDESRIRGLASNPSALFSYFSSRGWGAEQIAKTFCVEAGQDTTFIPHAIAAVKRVAIAPLQAVREECLRNLQALPH